MIRDFYSRVFYGSFLPSFCSNALAAVGGTTAGPGPCVINVYINYEKKFAFAELRTVEEASNAMALDGVMFEGVTVRVRRPADYDPVAAAKLGPSAPNPNLNLAAIALDKTKAQVAVAPQSNPFSDDPDRLFVGGLPYYLSEAECRELLGTFGTIKYFGLIRDRNTGVSKGYGFVIYEEKSVIDAAIAGLNGMKLGDRTLSVRKAELPNVPQQVQAPDTDGDGSHRAMFTVTKPKVIKLVQAVTMEELNDDDEYEDILDDMNDEMSKFGKVIALHIPRPPKDDSPPPPGVGKILVEFSEPEEALTARNKLHGRKFGGRIVEATLMTQEDYEAKHWD